MLKSLAVVFLSLVCAQPLRAETVLHSTTQDDFSGFDPDNTFDVSSRGPLLGVYEGLLQYAPGTTQLEGRLAERWSASPDGLTYEFTLRDGVRFQDGTPMTSADVLASFQRRRSDTLALSYFLANVKSLAAPDPTHFVVTMAKPQPSFLDTLASAWGPRVLSAAALSSHAGTDLAAGWLSSHALGTGPYGLAKFDRGQRYVFARNPYYWGAKPAYDRIEMAIVPDLGQQLLQLRAGDVDVIPHGYPFDQLASLPAGVAATSGNSLGLELAFVNVSRALKDEALRRAVVAAVAPQAWLSDAFGNYATPPQSLFPVAMLKPAQPIVFPADLDAARAAVAAHGQPTIEIGYSAEEAGVQQHVADLLIAQLQAVQINATAHPMPGDQVTGFVKDLQHAPDIFIAQNYPDAADPATQADLFFHTGGSLNIFGFSDPAVDALIDRADTTPNRAERLPLYEQAGRKLFDEGAFIPLADVQEVVVHRDTVSDVALRPAIPWTFDFGAVKPH